MRIEINPRSLLNLKHICEILYKLHPSVLDYLINMERSLGKILGMIDLDNVSLEEREFLANNTEEVNFTKEPKTEEYYKNYDYSKYDPNDFLELFNKICENDFSDSSDYLDEKSEKTKLLSRIKKLEEDENSRCFHDLRRYIQLNTDEYIPMKIYVEVEDPVIGRKVRELVETLVKTRAPEQFYLNKKELDEDAYFAEGYNLSMNDEQRKKFNIFFWSEDVEGLKELLRKEKLFP